MNGKIRVTFYLAVTLLMVCLSWLFIDSEQASKTVTEKQLVQQHSVASISLAANSSGPGKTENEADRADRGASQALLSTEKNDYPVAMEVDNKLSSDSLVALYLSQMANDDRTRYQELWPRILDCPVCLELIREGIETGTIAGNALLEFTHLLLEADHPLMVTMMEDLLRPDREGLTQQLLIKQVIITGRSQSYTKLLEVLQAYDTVGQSDYVFRQINLLTDIIAPESLQPTLDLALGHTNASIQLQSRVKLILQARMVYLPEDEEITRQLVDYYYNAVESEADEVWQLISRHGFSLVTIAKEADERGETNVVDKVFRSIENMRGDVAVQSILALQSKLDRPLPFFIEAMTKVVTKEPSVDALQRLENMLRDTTATREARMMAAEGLLAVKDTRQSRDILEKMMQSEDYADAELVSYISARL